MDSNFRFLVARPSNRYGRRDYCLEKRKPICWGTEGSNPAPSSGESIANLTSSERGDARARRGCQSVSNPTQSSYLATLGRRPAAELGIIAEAAGHEIARRAHVKYLDLSAVRAGLASIGAITGVRSTPTPAAALRRAGRRHLRGVSQKGAM